METRCLTSETNLKSLQIEFADLQARHRETLQALQREQQKSNEYEFGRGVTNARVTQAETMQSEAEVRAARAEQALEIARRVHSREMSQVKKDYEEMEMGLKESLESRTKQRDELVTALKTVNTLYDKWIAPGSF
jgi:hypothetical protein